MYHYSGWKVMTRWHGHIVHRVFEALLDIAMGQIKKTMPHFVLPLAKISSLAHVPMALVCTT